MIPYIWSSLFALAAVLGLLTLAGLFWRVEGLVRLYHESWPKVVVAIARVGSGIFAVFARSPANSEDEFGWNCAVVAAMVSWACWEFVQACGDSVAKEQATEATELNRQIKLRTELLVVLRDLVSGKKNRIVKMLDAGPTNATSIRSALAPGEHSYLVLDAFVFVLRSLRPDLDHESRMRQGFRIGLYAEENGGMTPILGYDSIHKARDPFSSHSTHAKYFKTTGRGELSVVAHCVRARKLQIVSDCEEASNRGRFVYYREDQRNYLKSMAAWPMLNLRSPSGRIGKGVISLDTNVSGYFRDSDSEFLDFLLQELAARLGFEIVLAQLLEQVPDAPNP